MKQNQLLCRTAVVPKRIVTPKPTDEFNNADLKHYAELSKQPCFLCVRAGK